MKTTVQKSALVTALLLLTACAGGPGGSSISLGIGGFGSHIGLGTSVNIPIGSPPQTQAASTLPKNKSSPILPQTAPLPNKPSKAAATAGCSTYSAAAIIWYKTFTATGKNVQIR